MIINYVIIGLLFIVTLLITLQMDSDNGKIANIKDMLIFGGAISGFVCANLRSENKGVLNPFWIVLLFTTFICFNQYILKQPDTLDSDTVGYFLGFSFGVTLPFGLWFLLVYGIRSVYEKRQNKKEKEEKDEN